MLDYLWTQMSMDTANGFPGRKIMSQMLSLKNGIATMPHSPTSCALSFSQTNISTFCNITTPQQDQLLADFTAVALTCEQAVTGGTHNNQSRAWGKWEKYCT
jgi:hypothetical protein